MNSLSSNKRTQIVWQIVLLVVICLLLVWLFEILGVFKPTNGPRQVQFSVDSSGGYATITLTHGTDLLQSGTVTTPWDKTITANNGEQVYLTAGNPSQFGTISCTIQVNGSQWKSQTVDAPQDKVACAGVIP
jgi:hypothetical protein